MSETTRETDSGDPAAADEEAVEWFDEKEQLDREGLKRATLIKEYNRLCDIDQPDPDESAEDATDTHQTDGTLHRIRELIRPTCLQKTIHDIETSPELDVESPADALEQHNLVAVRFVFADGSKSTRYAFASDSELPQIIDFYADGEFGDLFGTRVDVDETFGTQRILTPSPYETHTGHLKYPIARRIYAWDTMQENPMAEPLAPARVAAMISGLAFYALMGSAVLWGIATVMGGEPLVDGVADTCVAAIMGFITHLILGVFIDRGPFNYSVENHYRYVSDPMIVLWGGVKRRMARLNQR